MKQYKLKTFMIFYQTIYYLNIDEQKIILQNFLKLYTGQNIVIICTYNNFSNIEQSLILSKTKFISCNNYERRIIHLLLYRQASSSIYLCHTNLNIFNSIKIYKPVIIYIDVVEIEKSLRICTINPPILIYNIKEYKKINLASVLFLSEVNRKIYITSFMCIKKNYFYGYLKNFFFMYILVNKNLYIRMRHISIGYIFTNIIILVQNNYKNLNLIYCIKQNFRALKSKKNIDYFHNIFKLKKINKITKLYLPIQNNNFYSNISDVKKIFVNIGQEDGIFDISIFIKIISEITKIHMKHFTYIGQITKRSIYFELERPFVILFIKKLEYILKIEVIQCLNCILKIQHKNILNKYEKIICKMSRSSL